MKTVLLGMNSPTGKVLEFERSSSAGGRLFKLSGMSPVVYTLAFHRMNLLNKTEWNEEEARRAGTAFLPVLKRYRNVVVLGLKVWRCLDLEPVDWLESREVDGCRFWSIPHTSGLCHWYNDERNCRAVTRLLQRLAKEGEKVA
jgi:hypothetical protein